VSNKVVVTSTRVGGGVFAKFAGPMIGDVGVPASSAQDARIAAANRARKAGSVRIMDLRTPSDERFLERSHERTATRGFADGTIRARFTALFDTLPPSGHFRLRARHARQFPPLSRLMPPRSEPLPTLEVLFAPPDDAARERAWTDFVAASS